LWALWALWTWWPWGMVDVVDTRAGLWARRGKLPLFAASPALVTCRPPWIIVGGRRGGHAWPMALCHFILQHTAGGQVAEATSNTPSAAMTSGSLVVVTVVVVMVVVQRHDARVAKSNSRAARVGSTTATQHRRPATPRALRRATWLPGLAAT
jgi:hypothetical protein